MIVIDFPTNGGGGGGNISRPREIYVTSDGNDISGQVGHLSRPFETVSAAVAAGEATGFSYVIILGTGAFSVTNLASSALRAGFEGMGYATFLSINNEGLEVAVDERIHNLIISINTAGVNAPSENDPPGNAASITLRGQGWIQNLYARGGNAWIPSGYGSGIGADIILRGDLVALAGGYISTMYGSDSSGVSSTSGGGLFADGCDLRLSTGITTGTIYFGRCSYITSNITESGVPGNVTNNMGGNAVW